MAPDPVRSPADPLAIEKDPADRPVMVFDAVKVKTMGLALVEILDGEMTMVGGVVS